PSFRAMADFERPLANNSRTCNTSSPLYIPSPPLGRVWRRRSSEVGIFHSGDFAEYASGGFVHFSGSPAFLVQSGCGLEESSREPRTPLRSLRVGLLGMWGFLRGIEIGRASCRVRV